MEQRPAFRESVVRVVPVSVIEDFASSGPPPEQTFHVEQECVICADPNDGYVGLLECGHMFHFPCIQQWLEMRDYYPQCPVCRAPDTFAFRGELADLDNLCKASLSPSSRGDSVDT
jgi:hypothetical protein